MDLEKYRAADLVAQALALMTCGALPNRADGLLRLASTPVHLWSAGCLCFRQKDRPQSLHSNRTNGHSLHAFFPLPCWHWFMAFRCFRTCSASPLLQPDSMCLSMARSTFSPSTWMGLWHSRHVGAFLSPRIALLSQP